MARRVTLTHAGHSQAAPRTPLESPWRFFTTGVVQLSENTYAPRSRGTSW